MIHSVTIAPDGSVYSIKRGGGRSSVIAHTASSAMSLYETGDKLDGVWASPSGALHAVGKSYHTNVGGAWRASKLPAVGFRIWGHSDDEVFIGGTDGALLRGREGAWSTIAELGDLVTSIHGSGQVAHVVGYGFSRTLTSGTLQDHPLAGDSAPHLQDVVCIGSSTWYCSTDTVFVEDGDGVRELATVDDELYGVGIGKSGVIAHGGWQLLRLEGGQLVEYRSNDDKALMAQRATYSTTITSNGSRIVAGGANSVLVDDGDGFVVWPEVTAGSPAKTAKAKTTKPTTKTAKAKKQ